jgi:hypothetical protein
LATRHRGERDKPVWQSVITTASNSWFDFNAAPRNVQERERQAVYLATARAKNSAGSRGSQESLERKLQEGAKRVWALSLLTLEWGEVPWAAEGTCHGLTKDSVIQLGLFEVEGERLVGQTPAARWSSIGIRRQQTTATGEVSRPALSVLQPVQHENPPEACGDCVCVCRWGCDAARRRVFARGQKGTATRGQHTTQPYAPARTLL